MAQLGSVTQMSVRLLFLLHLVDELVAPEQLRSKVILMFAELAHLSLQSLVVLHHMVVRHHWLILHSVVFVVAFVALFIS